MLPDASAHERLSTLQIILLMRACLYAHSSHQPVEVSAVKRDHAAVQAQHLSTGITGERHTLNNIQTGAGHVMCGHDITHFKLNICS